MTPTLTFDPSFSRCPLRRVFFHRALGLLGALALAASLAACQPAGSEPPEPTLVIENGRVIVGDGQVLEDASVVVAGDNSIRAVTQDSVEAPNTRHNTRLQNAFRALIRLLGKNADNPA